MLILHGGRRSPFVRRVAITLTLQGRDFERNVVDLFGSDFSAYQQINPVGRVPALTIGPSEHLTETYAIIDWLEETAEQGGRLIPASGEARRKCFARIAHANGVCEKGVALAYEVGRRPAEFIWGAWRDRLTSQVEGGLAALEALIPDTGWLGGDAMDGSDVAVVRAYDYALTVTGYTPAHALPKLAALSDRAATIPAFATTKPQRAS